MITHSTTTRLRLRIRDKLHIFMSQRDPLVLIAGLISIPLIALSIGASVYRSLPPPPLTAIVPTFAPIILIATAPAVVVPTQAPIQVAATLPNTFTRAVVAYDSPNGSALGAIEQGRAYAVLARWGSDWLQADVVGSGVVWLKADQVLDLPSGLADLQPPPTAVVVERPIYVAAPMPAIATPESYTVASESLPTMPPQQAAIYDRQQWAIDAQRATR
jgi:hypothetical protein